MTARSAASEHRGADRRDTGSDPTVRSTPLRGPEHLEACRIDAKLRRVDGLAGNVFAVAGVTRAAR